MIAKKCRCCDQRDVPAGIALGVPGLDSRLL